MDKIYTFLTNSSELCKDAFIPILVTFTLIYLCGYIKQRAILYKKLNKYYDSFIQVMAKYYEEIEKVKDSKITDINNHRH